MATANRIEGIGGGSRGATSGGSRGPRNYDRGVLTPKKKPAPPKDKPKTTATKVPKKKREAFESGMTQYNKNVKKVLKSPEIKNSSDINIAKNKSGGSKPFSKGNYTPVGPKVLKKK